MPASGTGSTTWAASTSERPHWVASTPSSRRAAPSPRWCSPVTHRVQWSCTGTWPAIGANPNLSAALLIADGDRHPEDTTVNIGTASTDPEKTGGAAQDWPILAHAPALLPANIGVRTISVCDAGDAVCDYDPEAEETSPAAVAIHTSYTTADSDGQMWTWMVHQLLGGPGSASTPDAPQVPTTLS